MKQFLFMVSLLLVNSSLLAKNLTKVPIGAMSPMSLEDTEYSERFKAWYQAAFFYAMGEQSHKLSRCGYELALTSEFYDKKQTSIAKTHGEKFESSGVWIVFGPGKSRDFLVATKGLRKTAMVSPMATAKEVTNLVPPYFTMAYGNDELAESALRSVRKLGMGQSYGAFVDGGCGSCRDFSEQFDGMAKTRGIKKVFHLQFSGDGPDVANLKSKIKASKIEFLMLPNYSKSSGHVISALKDEFPKLKFVGGDGWGDGNYGFLTKYPLGKHQAGFCVRGGMPSDLAKERLDLNSLNYSWSGKPLDLSYTHFQVVEFVRKLAATLCEAKPKNKEGFTTALKSKDSAYFRSSLGVGVYELKGGDLNFSHTDKKETRLGNIR